MVSVAHLEELRNPEKPDPGGHLIQIDFHVLHHWLEDSAVDVLALEQLDHLRNHLFTLGQVKSDTAKVSLQAVSQSILAFFILEDYLVQTSIHKPSL